jgi:hypothetical protein
MGRGRHRFLDHWHRRELDHDGRRLTWVLMDGYDPPLAECFPWADGVGIHRSEAKRILAGHGHPDAQYVRDDTVIGGPLHR